MLKITPRNIDKIHAFLKSVPAGAKQESGRAVAEYLVGDDNHGLKQEPTWKFVSRAQAYGKVSDAPPGYFSWKQFRFVAAITEGFTKAYKRTHDLANSWTAKQVGSAWTITGEPGWVMGHNQANQPRLVGWRSYVSVIASNMRGAIRAGQQAVDRWLKERRR
jgi:hypothetical protein